MADDVTRDLVVGLQSISYSGSTSATLLSNSINIMIDSTDPNLWLPPDVCGAFEKAFGLTLDQTSGLYLVNDTHRDALLNSNAQVTFRLSDVKAGGDTVTVVLPYAAFDLTAGNPLVENTTHYFPLKRANNSTQYTLGRTFLQEACVHLHLHVLSPATDFLQLSVRRLRAKGLQRISVHMEPRRQGECRCHSTQRLQLDGPG